MNECIRWWTLRGSNPRPLPCEGNALPTELSVQCHFMLYYLIKNKLSSQYKKDECRRFFKEKNPDWGSSV